MTGSRLLRGIALIAVSVFAFVVLLAYAISVYLGTSELDFDDALAFFIFAVIVIAPVVLLLGALPIATSIVALSKKKKHPTESSER